VIGASVVAVFQPRKQLKKDWYVLLIGGIFAVAPDFDFFLVWILGLNRDWHRSFTHSIFFALFAGFLMLCGAKFTHFKLIIALTVCLLSHGILDFLGAN
jgi:membrane-bound metal-dependent hydrolase YbcI (DUF457 family)